MRMDWPSHLVDRNHCFNTLDGEWAFWYLLLLLKMGLASETDLGMLLMQVRQVLAVILNR